MFIESLRRAMLGGRERERKRREETKTREEED